MIHLKISWPLVFLLALIVDRFEVWRRYEVDVHSLGIHGNPSYHAPRSATHRWGKRRKLQVLCSYIRWSNICIVYYMEPHVHCHSPSPPVGPDCSVSYPALDRSGIPPAFNQTMTPVTHCLVGMRISQRSPRSSPVAAHSTVYWGLLTPRLGNSHLRRFYYEYPIGTGPSKRVRPFAG